MEVHETAARTKNEQLLIDTLESGSESLGEFSASEWTPPDSSYGAAIPVAGWIPKHIRRLIEFSVSALFVMLVVYIVITTSINTDRHQNTKYNNSLIELDDDLYVQYDDLYFFKYDDDIYDAEEEEYNQDANDQDDYFGD